MNKKDHNHCHLIQFFGIWESLHSDVCKTLKLRTLLFISNYCNIPTFSFNYIYFKQMHMYVNLHKVPGGSNSVWFPKLFCVFVQSSETKHCWHMAIAAGKRHSLCSQYMSWLHLQLGNDAAVFILVLSVALRMRCCCRKQSVERLNVLLICIYCSI